jgi:PAS domain S-box-containing protein
VPAPPKQQKIDAASAHHGWILILVLTCGSLAMIAAVWWYYTEQRRAMEAAVTRELAAIADVETNQIANWRSERIGDGRVLHSSTALAAARRILASHAPAVADREALKSLLEQMGREFLYTDAALVGLDGEVYIRLRQESVESAQFRQRVRRRLAKEAIEAHDVVLSDLNLETRDGRPLMSLTVPVEDRGAFILDIDPSKFLYPYLKSWPGPRRTAEILLVRRENNEVVYLSRPRLADASFPRRPLTLKLPSDEVLNAGWSLRAPDYRDVEVLGTVRRIPNSPWFLVVKIDVAEVYEPVRRLGWEMALVTALIGLANTAGAAVIWRNQRARAHLEQEALLYAVANDTPAYLWMTSATQENSFINRPLARLLGIDAQSLGTSWIKYLHPDDAGPAKVLFVDCMASRSPYRDEFRIRRYDGQFRWVANQAAPRFSSAGEFLGFAGALIDITERKRKDEEVQALTARLIDAQEDERKRLARELHDDLNQQIAALSIATGNLKRHIPLEQEEARAQSDRLHQKLVHVAETVRRMSHELHPAILEYSGLAPALQTYCREFGAMAGIRVSLDIRGTLDTVAAPVALCIYRIAQEALRNVAKHAGVAEAAVVLDRSEGRLRLSISDSGTGMDPESPNSAGLGLVSIRERARLVQGSVEIDSGPGHGTTIAVKIPDVT